TSTNLRTSQNPSPYGQPLTITSTVIANSPGQGTPTGTVDFEDGGTQIGSAQLFNGSATFITSKLAAGSHSLSAVYVGNSNYVESNSNSVENGFIEGVTKVTPAITWNNPANITYGTKLTGMQLNATASVAGTFSYSPAAGTVLL